MMLQHLGLQLEGWHHSGIDDCRNILQILVSLVGKLGDKVQPTAQYMQLVGAEHYNKVNYQIVLLTPNYEKCVHMYALLQVIFEVNISKS